VIRLAVRVAPEHAELLELAPGGVEETATDQYVEYAVYGPPGELPELPDLEAAAGDALVAIETTEVADDWAERWREFHKPLVLNDRLTVRPPWEPPGDTELDLVIDPGRAFGTGAHATTRLCLELLLELPGAGGRFVDLGCGSGVLAIAAAKLGYTPVIALDNDPAAIAAAQSNAGANAVELDVRRFDLRTDRVPEATTLAANLLRPLLLGYAARVVDPPERLVAGGLLESEADEIVATFGRRGLAEADRRVSDGWAAILLIADSRPD
jgi:ribosomal protein L11 methyltransferase